MITGIYKFYQDGKLIGESENNITELGRVLAIKTILGAVPSFGTSIQVGVGQAPNLFSYSPTTIAVTGTTPSQTVVMTVPSHNLSVGNAIIVNGITKTEISALNGKTQTITATTSTSITFVSSTSITNGTYTSAKSYTPTTIVVSGTTPTQTVVATIGAHSLSIGSSVSLTGITSTNITSLNNKSFIVTAINASSTITFISATSVTNGTYNGPGGTVTPSSFFTFGQLATNKNLDFKVASAPVISSYLSNISTYDGLAFKAKVDDPSSYRITEVALFSDSLLSGATNYKTENLVSFDTSENIELSGTSTIIEYTTGTSPRIGETALSLKSGTGNQVIVNSSFSNLDFFDNTDLIKIAFSSLSNVNLTTTFYSTGGSTMTYYHTGKSGYNVIPVAISQGTVSGSFEWSNITSIKFSSNEDIILDGVKFERSNVEDTNNGMVSRTVLTTPISKTSNVPVDIEYYLRLGFN